MSLTDESSLCFLVTIVDVGPSVGERRFSGIGIEIPSSFLLGKHVERFAHCTEALKSYGHESNNKKS